MSTIPNKYLHFNTNVNKKGPLNATRQGERSCKQIQLMFKSNTTQSSESPQCYQIYYSKKKNVVYYKYFDQGKQTKDLYI